jgi:phage FluMu gp28-like protein
MFRQEIMAEFIEGGLVFRNLARMMIADPIPGPVPGREYVMGVDLAKYNDFNVINVADIGTRCQVFQLRNNRLDWSYQKSSIYMQAKRWNNATVIIDRTGVGDAVVEDLQKMDCAYAGAPKQGSLTIIPVIFTTGTKPELYKQYILMQENDLIWMLKDPVSKYEHESFECELMPSGYTRYSAPANRNDDTVTAAALTAWGLGKVVGLASVIGPMTDDTMEKLKNPKKPIDPTCQIDVDAIIHQLESRQVAGHGYNDDDQRVCDDYDDK